MTELAPDREKGVVRESPLFGRRPAPAAVSFGRLWRSMVSPSETGDALLPLTAPVAFDTKPLAALLAGRGFRDDPSNPHDPRMVSAYLEALSELEAWEGGVASGFGYSDHQHSVWLTVHGKRDPPPAQPVRQSALFPRPQPLLARPNLLISVAGYSPRVKACDSVALSFSPMAYDPYINGWGADTSYAVLATGWHARGDIAPLTLQELQQLGELVDGIYNSLRLPPLESKGNGVYRSLIASQ